MGLISGLLLKFAAKIHAANFSSKLGLPLKFAAEICCCLARPSMFQKVPRCAPSVLFVLLVLLVLLVLACSGSSPGRPTEGYQD